MITQVIMKSSAIVYVIVILILLSCVKKEADEVDTKNNAGVSNAAGELLQAKQNIKTSSLIDIPGINLAYGDRCADCCDLKFDQTFGHDQPEQLQLIVTLISSNEIVADMECLMPVKYYAIEHLLYLAKEMQDVEAAKMILFQYDQLNLDGELAEGLVDDIIIPTLRNFRELDNLLLAKGDKALLRLLCDWSMTSDLSNAFGLISILRQIEGYHVRKFADRLQECMTEASK